jgi:hypothetical protein
MSGVPCASLRHRSRRSGYGRNQQGVPGIAARLDQVQAQRNQAASEPPATRPQQSVRDRVAELQGQARTNPAIRITREANAAHCFRSRGIADSARKEPPFCACVMNGIARSLKHQ